jgi:hypothetical protein
MTISNGIAVYGHQMRAAPQQPYGLYNRQHSFPPNAPSPLPGWMLRTKTDPALLERWLRAPNITYLHRTTWPEVPAEDWTDERYERWVEELHVNALGI